MTTTSPYTGTERYKAPELFISADNRHPRATFEGDIYSLGCLMVEVSNHPSKNGLSELLAIVY
jgi:serine/threonine protein kinase